MHNIYLHPEVKQLLQDMGNANPEQYATDLIRSKNGKAAGFKPNPVLASLIGDSLAVEFKGNTNNGGNAAAHKNFNPKIRGAIIANVAPNLGLPTFQKIFFNKDNKDLNPTIRTFYDLDNPEYVDLLGTTFKLNVRAYKKHFRVLAENNVMAAKTHCATKLVLSGMGLAIYAGPLRQNYAAIKVLGDLQFEVLEEIAADNPDIEFKFFGLGVESEKIGEYDNLEGIAFNTPRAMIEQADSGKILRVVAGSIDIPLGGGDGDNGQIATDTNAAAVRGKAEYRISNDDVLDLPIADPIMPMQLQDVLKIYIYEVKKLSTEFNMEIEEDSYTAIKSSIRILKNRDFSRFEDDAKFTAVIEAERNLLNALYNKRDATEPGFLRQIIELIKDIGSFFIRSLSAERSWADTVHQSAMAAIGHEI